MNDLYKLLSGEIDKIETDRLKARTRLEKAEKELKEGVFNLDNSIKTISLLGEEKEVSNKEFGRQCNKREALEDFRTLLAGKGLI